MRGKRKLISHLNDQLYNEASAPREDADSLINITINLLHEIFLGITTDEEANEILRHLTIRLPQ